MTDLVIVLASGCIALWLITKESSLVLAYNFLVYLLCTYLMSLQSWGRYFLADFHLFVLILTIIIVAACYLLAVRESIKIGFVLLAIVSSLALVNAVLYRMDIIARNYYLMAYEAYPYLRIGVIAAILAELIRHDFGQSDGLHNGSSDWNKHDSSGSGDSMRNFAKSLFRVARA